MPAQQVFCPLEGYTDCWIEGPEKLTVRLKNEWVKASTDENIPQVAFKIVKAWNLRNADGTPAPDPSIGPDALLDLDVAVESWFYRAVTTLITNRQQVGFQNESPLAK